MRIEKRTPIPRMRKPNPNWEPAPGMHKLECSKCGHWFASASTVELCPSCAAKGTGRPNWRRKLGGDYRDYADRCGRCEHDRWQNELVGTCTELGIDVYHHDILPCSWFAPKGAHEPAG